MNATGAGAAAATLATRGALRLGSIQGEDGSWPDFPMYGYGHAYGTSFAVLALEACLRSLESGS